MQVSSNLPRQDTPIDEAIMASILARRVRPGSRLGETDLATLYGVSRTLVREAMMRLEARHIVEVRSRRGWFVVEPSVEEAKRVFQARRVLETGAIRLLPALTSEQTIRLHAHLAAERQAMTDGDHPRLVCLMGDFHIRIIEILGNPVLAGIMRDLTARTTLISMLYQSDDHAEESHRGHGRIVAALERGDRQAAAEEAIRHLDEVEAGLDFDIAADPLAELRRSLLPPDASARPSILPS